MLLKAIKCKKQQNTIDKDNVNVDNETLNKYVSILQKMLRCKTVFNYVEYDDTEFSKFRNVLKEEFPLLNSRAELSIFGSGCIVYKIQGKGDKNIVLMSHHDVVDADYDKWDYDPFGAEIHDGYIYARGSIDTKTPLFGELQAVEELLEEGYEFPFNLYIASSNNEELCGDGIVKAVEYFKENNIYFDFVIDEGGAIIEGQFPGMDLPCAMVAVHEKGRHTYTLKAKKEVSKDAGHSGLTCMTDNPIDRMSMFIDEIQHFKWRISLYDEVRETFIRVCPYMTFPYRFIFSNIDTLKPLLLKILPKVNSSIKAMLSNSVSITNINGNGIYDMVQAKEVTATAFFRCIREDDLFTEIEEFKKVADKYGIEVTEKLRDYCEPASFQNKEYKCIEDTIREIFPRVPVAPFLLTAGSDSRRFNKVAKNIYRFAPLVLTKEQFASIHSNNEKIAVENVGEIVCFYKKLIKNLYKD